MGGKNFKFDPTVENDCVWDKIFSFESCFRNLGNTDQSDEIMI
jgi:hypothetical protein